MKRGSNFYVPMETVKSVAVTALVEIANPKLNVLVGAARTTEDAGRIIWGTSYGVRGLNCAFLFRWNLFLRQREILKTEYFYRP